MTRSAAALRMHLLVLSKNKKTLAEIVGSTHENDAWLSTTKIKNGIHPMFGISGVTSETKNSVKTIVPRMPHYIWQLTVCAKVVPSIHSVQNLLCNIEI